MTRPMQPPNGTKHSSTSKRATQMVICDAYLHAYLQLVPYGLGGTCRPVDASSHDAVGQVATQVRNQTHTESYTQLWGGHNVHSAGLNR